MRTALLLATCAPLVLRVGCSSCDGTQGTDTPCVDDDAGGGTANTIPFDQVCPLVSDGLYTSLVRGGLGDTCGVPLLPTDLPHLAPPGLTTTVVFVDLLPALVCDAGATGPPGLKQAFLPIPTVLASSAASLSAGRMRYDGAKAWQCRQLGLAARGDAGALPEACTEILVGAVSPGGVCMSTEECFDGGFCRPSGRDSCLGVCAVPLATGMPCEQGRDLCVGSCERVGTVWQCADPTAPIPAGQACPTQVQELCDQGTCIPQAGTDAGVCAANALRGQPCGTASTGLPKCADACDRCASLDGGARRCLSARIGSDCGADSDCVPFSYCAVPAGADAGACTLKARPGETCVVAGGRDGCLWGDTFCGFGGASQVCLPRPQLGGGVRHHREPDAAVPRRRVL